MPRKLFWISLSLGIVIVGSAIAGNFWLPERIGSAIRNSLARRGLTAEWSHLSWLPFRGLNVKDLVIREAGGERGLVCRTAEVHVRVPLWRAFDRDLRVAHWKVSDETVTLGDARGEMKLENVSARFETSLGQVAVDKLTARHGGLSAELRGEILLKTERRQPRPFRLNLQALRGSLATLEFSDKGDDFEVTGNFTVDATGPEIFWKSKLNGAGEDIIWKDTELTEATAEADLSSADSVIRTAVSSTNGSASAVITKKGWKETPFDFEGTIKDRAGRTDTFDGSYAKGQFTIARLKGDADLLAIARGIPQLSGKLPQGLEFTRFPDLDARDARWTRDRGWSVASARLGGNGAAVITAENTRVEATAISGVVGYDGAGLSIDDGRLAAFGGDFSIEGIYQDGSLRKSVVTAKDLKLTEIKRAGKRPVGKGTKGVLSLSYRGSIRLSDRAFDGAGSMRLDDAPVFEVPLLDEVYGLFAAIVPGAKHSGDGRFEADFAGDGHVISVKRFKATGGSLSVTAEGTADLKKETVSGTARGNLAGPPGVLTRPIGKLLEMEVSGNFRKIEVKPVGPAQSIADAASGTGGKIVETLEKVGDKIRGGNEGDREKGSQE